MPCSCGRHRQNVCWGCNSPILKQKTALREGGRGGSHLSKHLPSGAIPSSTRVCSGGFGSTAWQPEPCQSRVPQDSIVCNSLFLVFVSWKLAAEQIQGSCASQCGCGQHSAHSYQQGAWQGGGGTQGQGKERIRRDSIGKGETAVGSCKSHTIPSTLCQQQRGKNAISVPSEA